jgi:hypothetical protein
VRLRVPVTVRLKRAGTRLSITARHTASSWSEVRTSSRAEQVTRHCSVLPARSCPSVSTPASMIIVSVDGGSQRLIAGS